MIFTHMLSINPLPKMNRSSGGSGGSGGSGSGGSGSGGSGSGDLISALFFDSKVCRPFQ